MWRFFTQNTSSFCEKMDHNFGFQDERNSSAQKGRKLVSITLALERNQPINHLALTLKFDNSDLLTR
jgi:hypothetical protein